MSEQVDIAMDPGVVYINFELHGVAEAALKRIYGDVAVPQPGEVVEAEVVSAEHQQKETAGVGVPTIRAHSAPRYQFRPRQPV